MTVEDFETVLNLIDDLMFLQEIHGGHLLVLSDGRLALTLRFLTNGESLQSLFFDFRISRVAVSYIIKSCFDTLVERMVPIFISLSSSSDEWHKIASKFENLTWILGVMVKIIMANLDYTKILKMKRLSSLSMIH